MVKPEAFAGRGLRSGRNVALGGCFLEPSYGPMADEALRLIYGSGWQIYDVPSASFFLGGIISTKGGAMQALRPHVAGVDVHKDILAISTLIGEADQEPKVEHFECSTMTEDLKAMGIVLLEMGVKEVAMESTGVYWKPVYNVWEPMGLKCIG